MLKNRNKWFYAFIVAAVLLVAAVVAIVVIGGQTEQPSQVIEIPEGPETGVYYYGVEQGEIILSLNGGNKFTIAGPGLNRSGTYTVDGQNLAFTFVQGNDVATATMGNNVVTMTLNGAVMTFMKQVNYTVTFNTNGGDSIAAVQVCNGKMVAMPASPAKAGHVFIGWYADAECKTAYQFSNAVTGDITVYAGWVEKEAGVIEYTANFDLGYEGAEQLASMTTINGKLYNIPTPTRNGYTFAGWFVSMYEDGQKLTAACTEDTVLTANTTLYAVWVENGGSKLAAPAVSVTATGIKWAPINGASAYELIVRDAEGFVVFEETLGATSKNYDFSALAAGDYTVEVKAVASNTANNSDVDVRYFRNKALDRVSQFQVINGMLVFNAVENAQNYLITIDCGNADHNHKLQNNGNSTVYNFSNCQMQEGGIRFTVIATANGYANSVPQTFVYERNLAAVENLAYDAAGDRFVWDLVADAATYMVTVTVGEETFTFNNGVSNSFSIAAFTGNISISVVPVTDGFNTPAAVTANCNKTAPAAPQNVRVEDMVILWDEVAGATKYEVKVGSTTYEVTGNSLDLVAKKFDASVGENYQIMVKAIANSEASSYSKPITVQYRNMDTTMSYSGNTVYWTPVLGGNNYDVRVNGGEAIRVSGTNAMKVVLTKAGINVIEVRCADLSSGEWVAIEVYAYEVVYNSRTLGGEVREYLAIGDTMMLPEHFTSEGYNFAGWYNTPGAAIGNGKEYTGTVFNGNGNMILFANWSPKDYTIKFIVDSTITNIANESTESVTYTKDFTLTPAITSDKTLGYFVGWYTGPQGSGVQVTDSDGKSVAPYNVIGETVVYPYFADALSYEKLSDGTWAVKKGPGIANKNVTEILIPATYQDAPITQILDNAFYNCSSITSVKIPDSVTRVGIGAFENCTKLEKFEVYEVDPGSTTEKIYGSDNGALLYYDEASGNTYLEIFPRAKTGTYTVPETVDNIRPYAFKYSNIEKVIISKGVTQISESAFYRCYKLRTIEFEFEREETVTIIDNAFVDLTRVETLILPAKLNQINDIKMLDKLEALKYIRVEEGGEYYSAVDNLLCDALGTSLLYVPKSFAGVFEAPIGVSGIGSNVFAGNKNITEVIIPAYVNFIGENAFAGCSGLRKVTVLGPRNNNLEIHAQAFASCGRLQELTFEGQEGLGGGAITIGERAFIACEELEVLNVGPGVIIASIGEQAFQNNVALNELNIDVTAVVSAIGDYAFAGCLSIKEYLVHASTASVGNYAFSGCKYLETVEFASNGGQISFGQGVFQDCERLTTIKLPATLAAFDGSVFDGCEHIATIEVDPGNPYLETYNGSLYTKGLTELIYYPRSLDGDLTKLPWDTLTKIGASVFKGNHKITSVVIGAKVTALGNNAFDSCINLTSVTFANLNSEMVIGNLAFSGCSNLTTVELPNGTTKIGAKAFYMTKLAQIDLPATVTSIGTMAFAYTDITAVEFPAALTFVGQGAFYKASKLASVTFAEGTFGLILGGTEDEKINEIAGDENKGVFEGTVLTEVVLPANLLGIGDNAFTEVTTLNSVTIPSNAQLLEIGASAFYKTNISAITLPNNLKYINTNAFCLTKLTTVTIPGSVQVISAYAFGTNTLTEILFAEGDMDPGLTIESHALVGTAISEITLPAHLIAIGDYDTTYLYHAVVDVFYKKATTTTSTTHLTDNTNLTKINVAEGGAKYGSKDGILYERGANGELAVLLFCPKGNSGEILIPNTVINVQSSAFLDTKITKIVFEEFEKDDPRYGQPLLTLGAYADIYASPAVFGSANSGGSAYTSLTYIQFPSHLAEAFTNTCYALNIHPQAERGTVDLVFNPDSTVAINRRAFRNNNALRSVALPNVTKMGERAFTQNSKLETVTFGAGSTPTELGDFCFEGCGMLTAIEIPATVKMLGSKCFSGCRAMTSFKQAEGGVLEVLGESAFASCVSFTTFKIPDTVNVVDSNVFSGCSSLKTLELSASLQNPRPAQGSIISNCNALVEIIVPEDHAYLTTVDGVLYDKQLTILYAYPASKGVLSEPIPDTVHTIEGGAFYNYTGTSIQLPAGLRYIRNNAFYNAKLTSIDIPAGVLEINENAFYGCRDMKVINIPQNSKLEYLGRYAFAEAQVTELFLPDTISTMESYALANLRQLKHVVLPAGLKKLPTYLFSYSAIETVVIQEGVTEISTRAFANCSSLKSISVPDTVMKMGDYVFFNCKALETVTMTENSMMQEIQQRCFYNCVALKDVTFGPLVATVGGEIFYGCANMKHVVLGDAMTSVPDNMFKDCIYLESVTIPEAAVSIGANAFLNCVALPEISISASVKTIGENAFSGCANLATVNVESGNAIQYISNGAFNGCVSLNNIDLPATVVEIGNYAFANTAITEAPISANTTKIGAYAFYNCTGLTIISVPSSVTNIGAYAFANCVNVESLALSAGLKNIGDFAFSDLVKIQSVTIPETVAFMGANPFANCVSLTELKLDSSNESFINIDGVLFDKTMYTLISYPTYKTDATYEIPDSVYEISGGAFSGSQLQSIVITENIRVISESAFRNSRNLTTVLIPGSVHTIAKSAFQDCVLLDNVVLPASVETLQEYAFAGCSSLATFTLAERKTDLLPSAHLFEGCTSLTQMIEFPGMTAFADYMYANTGIVNLVVPVSITNLDSKGVFANCTSLVSARLPHNATGTLGGRFFYGCTALETIELPTGINRLGTNGKSTATEQIPSVGETFANCTSLRSITMSVTGLMGSDFENCTSLVSITHTMGTFQTAKRSFANCTSLSDPAVITMMSDFAQEVMANCTGLTGEVVLNNRLMTIADDAFTGCVNIERLVIGGIDQITTYGLRGLPATTTVFFKNFSSLEKIANRMGNVEFASNTEAQLEFASAGGNNNKVDYSLTEKEQAQLEEFIGANGLPKDFIETIGKKWVEYKATFCELEPGKELSKEEMEQLNRFIEEFKIDPKMAEELSKQWVEYKMTLAAELAKSPFVLTEEEMKQLEMFVGDNGLDKSMLTYIRDQWIGYKKTFSDTNPGKELTKEEEAQLMEFMDRIGLKDEKVRENLKMQWIEYRMTLAESNKVEVSYLTDKEIEEIDLHAMKFGLTEEVTKQIKDALNQYKINFNEMEPGKELSKEEVAQLEAFLQSLDIPKDAYEGLFNKLMEDWPAYKMELAAGVKKAQISKEEEESIMMFVEKNGLDKELVEKIKSDLYTYKRFFSETTMVKELTDAEKQQLSAYIESLGMPAEKMLEELSMQWVELKNRLISGK